MLNPGRKRMLLDLATIPVAFWQLYRLFGAAATACTMGATAGMLNTGGSVNQIHGSSN